MREIISINTANWGTFWVSYNDIDNEGAWEDEYGNPVSETMPWAGGQPDNDAGNENCGRRHDDKLNDVPCTLTDNYICYIGAGKK